MRYLLVLVISFLLCGCPPAPDNRPVYSKNNEIHRIVRQGLVYYSRNPCDTQEFWYRNDGSRVFQGSFLDKDLDAIWTRETNKLPTEDGIKVVDDFNELMPEND